MNTMTLPLSRLEPFKGEWENCAISIGKSSVLFDPDSPCWREFNERRKVFVEPNATPAKARGLGDTIAKITSAVGIKPCGGCNRRKAMLNKIVPYKPNE